MDNKQREIWLKIYQDLITSPNDSATLETIIQARQSLASENPPIHEAVNSGIINFIIEVLDSSNDEIVQESIWVLINIAYGRHEHVRSLVSSGVVPKLIRHLKNVRRSPGVYKNAAWVLANICGDGPEICQNLIQEGVIDAIIQIKNFILCRSSTRGRRRMCKLEFRRSIAWICLNISRNASRPISKIEPLFDFIFELMKVELDKRVTIDSCYFFTHVVLGSTISMISGPTILKMLEKFSVILNRKELYTLESSLNFVREVAKYSQITYREQIFKSGILPQIVRLSTHEHRIVNHLSINIFRHLMMGFHSVSNMQQFIQSNMLETLSTIFEGERFMTKSKREGILILKCFMLKGTRSQIRTLFTSSHEDLWTSFSLMLRSKEETLVLDCVKFFKCIDLHVMDTSHPWVINQLYLFGIPEAFNEIVEHTSDEIHEISTRLLRSYGYPETYYNPYEYGQAEE